MSSSTPSTTSTPTPGPNSDTGWSVAGNNNTVLGDATPTTVALRLNGGPLYEAGALYFVIGFYLLTLAAETLWLLPPGWSSVPPTWRRRSCSARAPPGPWRKVMA